MNHADAVQALRTLHESVSPMVIRLAQNQPLTKTDRMVIRRMPSVSRELLEASGLSEVAVSPFSQPVAEGRATRALCALLEGTTALLNQCARLPVTRALDDPDRLRAIHVITWDLVYSLGLEGT